MEQSGLEQFKGEVHRILISKLDLEKLSHVNSAQARQAVATMVNEIIAIQRVPLSLDQQEKVQSDLLDEVFGLGPLEALLKDPKISDILVNDRDHVFIERAGKLDGYHHRAAKLRRRPANRRLIGKPEDNPAIAALVNGPLTFDDHRKANRGRRPGGLLRSGCTAPGADGDSVALEDRAGLVLGESTGLEHSVEVDWR